MYSGGSGGGAGFVARRGEFFREFFDETLRRPGAGFAEGADGSAGDVVGDGLERVRILHDAAAEQHAVGDLLHPERAFAARRALAAALVRVEFVDVVQRPDHVARVVHHDHAAGAGHRAGGGERIEIHRDFIDRHFAFDVDAVGLLSLSLKRLVGAQDFRRAAAGNDGLERSALLAGRRHVVDQLAHRDRADFDFEITGTSARRR